jgi:polysaccharide export outer membrane protein
MSIEHFGKGLRLWMAVCWLVVGGGFLAGCRTSSPEQHFADLPPGLASAPAASASTASSAAPVTAVASPAPAQAPVATSVPKRAEVLPVTNDAAPEPDVLRVGDTLTVTVTDTPTPIPAFEEKIKEDRTITLTFNEIFVADGKTPGELEKEIRARYVPNYFKQMTVVVKHDVSTRWYYVDGEVKAPNRQIYNSRITLLKAIASAGGFTDFANKKAVQLTRVDGRTQKVNCVKARNDPKLDPEVYPGDRIYVPRRFL